MKKKAKKLIKLISWAVFAVVVTGVAYTYFSAQSRLDRQSNTKDLSSRPENTAIEEPKTDNGQADQTNPVDLSAVKIPILMYHYIRDYNNPKDSIGNNLSVSPAKFSSQLDYLQSKGYHTTTFESIENGDIPDKPVILTFDDGYIDFYQNAFPEFKKRQMVGVAYIITSFNGGQYMNNDQIKEINSYGIEIGSHTVTHPDLTKISTDKVKTEIFSSKSVLEKIIGKDIISFCYPSGKNNPDVVNIVKSAGYKFATTTASGTANFNEPLTLSRYRIAPDTDITKLLK